MSAPDASKVVVLISGGNAGIGVEIVKKLANEYSTSHQILMGTRSLEKGEAAWKLLGSPTNVSPVQLDITDDASIERLYHHIETSYGKLDILINNAATAGRDLGEIEGEGFRGVGVSVRQVYTHVYNVNVISTAALTDHLLPLLEKAELPKIIFVSSGIGSIAGLVDGEGPPFECPWYSSSKSAVNYLAVYYAKLYPNLKSNAVCPGLNATGLNGIQLTEDTNPRKGAIRVTQLVAEGRDGVSGTFSNKDGPMRW
ncbi:hypothetical protein PV10_08395 [Exophiala mesophila]|uniref:NAD(P)-binding protein n=1 Tax=Exophiala mesophila TaxID=212818 RepID=A0A0D1ZPL3_EXOME|nr:uncharacterized protein PV10_08395 [Exophiala mesophila]KIV88743.1 hypothetical protein PV10_08395 [Exophiala mesophila]